MTRDVRNVYKALLIRSPKIALVQDYIDAYNEYNDYKLGVLKNAIKRKIVRVYFPIIRKPKYLRWIESYMVKKDENSN